MSTQIQTSVGLDGYVMRRGLAEIRAKSLMDRTDLDPGSDTPGLFPQLPACSLSAQPTDISVWCAKL